MVPVAVAPSIVKSLPAAFIGEWASTALEAAPSVFSSVLLASDMAVDMGEAASSALEVAALVVNAVPHQKLHGAAPSVVSSFLLTTICYCISSIAGCTFCCQVIASSSYRRVRISCL